MRRVVVVGSGLAGVRTAQELRHRGYAGALTVLGAEPDPPYDRPPLSKAVLRAGMADVPTALADTRLDVDLAALDVDLRLGVRATGLGPDTVTTDAGELPYDGLVLAFGSAPIRLPGDPAVPTLRTSRDAAAIRAGLQPGARVVIVGAGWIGAELATAAAGHGAEVTVVEAAPAPLPLLGGQVGTRMTALYAGAGVTVRASTAVSSIAIDHVADGGRVDADLVVVAVGVRPDLGWLAGSGLELGDGVLVDAALRASAPGGVAPTVAAPGVVAPGVVAPAVVAAGDCAERWSPRQGRRVRTEHWDDALHAPEVAAASLLDPGSATVYDPVPYVWSEQFGRYVQCVGSFTGEPTLWREEGTGWAAGWVDDGDRLTGCVTVDRKRDAVQARKAIAAAAAVDRQRFADPAVPLRSALR
jgi:3-phenylpropionate/trans-cinnamate dioxygenase ferredoxin reductase component